MDDKPEYYKACKSNGCRRAKWHDYYSRCIYLITINKAQRIPAFASIQPPSQRNLIAKTELTPLGEDIKKTILMLESRYPFVRILRRAVMPEHVHFIIFVTQKTDCHLGKIIATFKGLCTCHYHGIKDTDDTSGLNLTPVFEQGYNDRIVTHKSQLSRIINYVDDNPRRRYDRITHRGYHSRHFLVDDEGNTYEAYGNLQLLHNRQIEAVKVSRSYTPDELVAKKRAWLQAIQTGGVIVSPFISKAEKAVKNWAYDNGGNVIYLELNGFGKNYAPKEPMHTLCSEGRLQLIAPTSHSYSAHTTTREECLRMNDLAVKIANHRLKER